jgi:hypothetical protein
MARYKVGYLIGSLAKGSINRTLAQALVRLAPAELVMVEISFKEWHSVCSMRATYKLVRANITTARCRLWIECAFASGCSLIAYKQRIDQQDTKNQSDRNQDLMHHRSRLSGLRAKRASGSNLTFESRNGFPLDSTRASLAYVKRDFHHSQARRSPPSVRARAGS